MDRELYHYGTPRHSGRYPWGSGKDPYQSARAFLHKIDELKESGMSEAEIAKWFDVSQSTLRGQKTLAKSDERTYLIRQAQKLRDKGWSYQAIADRYGLKGESSVRNLLSKNEKARANVVRMTADMLKKELAEKKYLDIGTGAEMEVNVGLENQLGISREKLRAAVNSLKDEGYKVYYVTVKQLGTGKPTTVKVLASPDGEWSELKNDPSLIKSVGAYRPRDEVAYDYVRPPTSVSSDRIQIRYAEEGGTDKDGVIELRRGVPELSLLDAKYAQVRIAVDDSLYLKGMAVYADDLPDGIDIRFNTNKHVGTPLAPSADGTREGVLKPLKSEENPFGAVIYQRDYTLPDGTKRLSPINIVNEEGDWDNWGRTIASQMLSKQPVSLARDQLNITLDRKKKEFEEIKSLTNPQVKSQLMAEFAESCDSDAVHLKAAALPGQRTHVLLPFPELSEKEIYAPNYPDGTDVVLIRFPHGGTFEIPELIVNNKSQSVKKIIGQAVDAVGINPKVAVQLSGADFDGDTVLVIPNDKGRIRSSSAIKELANFDPKEAYPYREGMKVMTKSNTQPQMGRISNLITDMTVQGADLDEICRAVKHSMVVIDAAKHKLDYTQSYIDNQIADLKAKYQSKKDGSPPGGASTLLSKSKSAEYVPERKLGVTMLDPITGKKKQVYIDPDTGEKLYSPTGRRAWKRVEKPDGTVEYLDMGPKLQKSTKMAEAKDARALSSGTEIENVYADYANSLKSMANEARKLSLSTESIPYSPSAAETYKDEVASLKAQLVRAKRNAPLERQAQVLATAKVQALLDDNPSMDKDDRKKAERVALRQARAITGANKGKTQVHVTDREWQAIQAGAIRKTTLADILKHTNMDRIRSLATPRKDVSITPSMLSRAEAMIANGASQGDVAAHLGISVSTLINAMRAQ